jgi:polyhydroxyalkanoate synthase subunit PhaC
VATRVRTRPEQRDPDTPVDGRPLPPSRRGIDVLLAEAAVGGTGAGRFVQPRAALRTAAGLARHPGRTASRLSRLGGELARVAAGRSQLEAPRDRRFSDRGWTGNPLFRRMLQTYLAVTEAADGLISDAELGWQDEVQARFAVSNVLDALAPSNYAWSNPAVVKETIDRGGSNLVLGARRFVRDVSRPPHLPAMVDTTKFEVGGNLAVTPGAVVLRTAVFELLQYEPQTEEVHEVPLLIAPPTINKYYVLDLGPGRSLAEYYVSQGQQTFMISWRNPEEQHGHFDLDTYAGAVREALEAAAQITGSPRVHLAGACSGGIIATALAGHLAAAGRLDLLAGLTLYVAALDLREAGAASGLASREMLATAVAESARRGYIDGTSLASVFAWLRPNDLIWNYVVNNYLMGAPLPAFDILYWNQDTVRMSAGTHRDFIHMGLENSLARPRALKVLGSAVDLADVDLDAYVLAGITDHLVPWRNAARATELLGGHTRFVLSRSGHIQALVNPPGEKNRSSYRATEDPVRDHEAFLARSPEHLGSWWPDHAAWLAERSGGTRPAPRELGSAEHPALARAPGSYVHAR